MRRTLERPHRHPREQLEQRRHIHEKDPRTALVSVRGAFNGMRETSCYEVAAFVNGNSHGVVVDIHEIFV